MTRRRTEAVLWALALVLLALGWMRWRAAEPRGAAPPGALATAPAAPRRVPHARLVAAQATVAGGNPFRLDRAPAPVGFGEPPQPAGDFPEYVPPPEPRPQLFISGIVGPPWQALLEGVPGREGAVVVKRGDVLGDLRVREVTQSAVVVASPDTTWRLTVRNPWQ